MTSGTSEAGVLDGANTFDPINAPGVQATAPHSTRERGRMTRFMARKMNHRLTW